MTPYFTDGQVTLLHGHVIDQLRTLPDESVQCVITSPPYWALRSYGTEAQVWGGDSAHEHEWNGSVRTLQKGTISEKQSTHKGNNGEGFTVSDSHCPCGAWRGELGHEPTPQMFVAHLVDVFREVKRVLKSDGVCFVNLGDSYANTGNAGQDFSASKVGYGGNGRGRIGGQPVKAMPPGLKQKDLVLIPERFSIAMQDDGWYVRSRIAWCKRAPMPESVRDRPTNAWEHIWMFTKSCRYFWDQDAVREPHVYGMKGGQFSTSYRAAQLEAQNGSLNVERTMNPAGRNLWSYWLLSPDPEPLAHFATFPREIPRRCIAAATREGDTVLDPFCGSGTTNLVARSMLRRSIGIDLNETYLHDIALKKNAQMAMIPDLEVPA